MLRVQLQDTTFQYGHVYNENTLQIRQTCLGWPRCSHSRLGVINRFIASLIPSVDVMHILRPEGLGTRLVHGMAYFMCCTNLN